MAKFWAVVVAGVLCSGCVVLSGTDRSGDEPSLDPMTTIASADAPGPRATTTSTTIGTGGPGSVVAATRAWLDDHQQDLKVSVGLVQQLVQRLEAGNGPGLPVPCQALGIWANAMDREPAVPDSAIDATWQKVIGSARRSSDTCLRSIKMRDPVMAETAAALDDLGWASERLAVQVAALGH